MADGDLFTDAGFSIPAGAPAPQEPSLFAGAGYNLPKNQQFSDEIPIPVPGTPGYQPGEAHRTRWEQLEDQLAEFNRAIAPETVIPKVASNWWDATKHAFESGAQTYQKGTGEIPVGMTASGVGNIGLGALGMAGAPINGALRAFIGEPVTQLTGNPAIGEDVERTAGFLLPTKAAPAAVKMTAEGNAVNALVKTIGPENVPDVVAAARANPRTMLMDVSPPVRTVSRGLLDPAQPTAQNIIVGAVKNRTQSLPSWVNSAYTATMGPSPNVPLMLDALKARAQIIGQQQIEPVIANTKPVNVTPVLNLIDKEFSDTPIGAAALRKIKQGDVPAFPLSDYQQKLLSLRTQLSSDFKDRAHFLDADGTQGAHAVQAGLRADAQNLLSSSTGSDRLLGGKLMNIRNALVEAIDDASGGAYKPALSNYRDAMQVQDAFNEGFSGDVLKNRPGRVEDTPEAFGRWLDQATPEQVVAKRLGTRANIDMQIRGAKNQGLKGENITGIEYNQDKLRSLFGDAEANRLINAMMSAQQEGRTATSILGGSETAQTQAGQRALERPKIGGGNILNWIGVPAAEMAGEYLLGPAGMGLGAGGFALAKAGQYGFQAASRALATQRNIAFARAASATGAAKAPILEALMNHPAVIRQLQRRVSGNALSKTFGP